MNRHTTRRTFLKTAASSSLALAAAGGTALGEARPPEATPMSEQLPPVRALTRGPKHHWFGYYDKWEFDPTCRFVLGMEVEFEGRSPRADDVIKVGMVDTQDGDKWIELGETRAWCWQQGCMLQWRPGSDSEVLWNDREGDRFVCHILDVNTREKRTIPHPVYTVTPDGRLGAAPDFRRVNHMRPGYGYTGLPDPNHDVLVPEDSGIFQVDLDTGESELIVSIADAVAFGEPLDDWPGAQHYFNHLLWNTDGTRLEFLHRWRPAGTKTFRTRMLTASPEGEDLCVVDSSGHTSHFIWRDPQHILAWSRHPSHGDAFYLFRDGATDAAEVVGHGVMKVNGHCTYLPGNEWILNDTYPDKERKQEVYLYHVASGEKASLGRFLSPPEYKGEWRCDTHPRFSPDGKTVVIDSTHGGEGRQLYMIDVSEIVA